MIAPNSNIRDVSDADGELRWRPHTDPLLRAATEHHAALHGSSSAVLVQDGNGEIVAANPAAVALLGLSWRQLVGLTSLDPRWQAVTEDGMPLPGDRHPALVALTTGRPVTGFLMGVIIPPEARTVWLDIDAQPLPMLEPGAVSRPAPVCGVMVRFTDISGSPRGRRACDNLVQAYRLLADNASDIVLRSESFPTSRDAGSAGSSAVTGAVRVHVAVAET
ncbi:PAS domain-containing protein [Kineosporia succinea]|uniref:PAS domain-containing protein n=1 Tax=Kineosporia succinea TaxID=84632 RepID=A0ABT9PA67_9ACTN|nr:PAS domain-containing protein [Kineosporia succinea]MDP9829596.1 PAS domain-containing protein [Kineosporia succinea]